MSKYVGKAYDIDDITYILKEYSEKIPEKVISDIYFKLLDYVPTDKELGFISTEVSKWTLKKRLKLNYAISVVVMVIFVMILTESQYVDCVR